MKAGRELDALIAEKVMGWIGYSIVSINVLYPPNREHWKEEPAKEGQEWNYDSERFYDSREGGATQPIVPHYSTQIADAWLVVEKLLETPAYFLMEKVYQHETNHWEKWWVQVNSAHVQADTAPLAICLAALKAVE